MTKNSPMTVGELSNLSKEQLDFYENEFEFCEEVQSSAEKLKELTSTEAMETGVDYQEIIETCICLMYYAYNMRDTKKNMIAS